MKILKKISFALLFLGLGCAFGQECTLNISGADSTNIASAFQLNESQLQKMGQWQRELSRETDRLMEQLTALMETHPRETESELAALGSKYEALRAQILEITISYDRRLLAIFNERQYARYLELCEAVSREPLAPWKDPQEALPDQN
ncbi:hypothetical protein ACT6NV_10910 [Robiginitalea sp. IMCC44478]|uniref:hypothetical protein n=1 Tax=Robiginitalea sp. IMCC44478 TaxID=3459122 RepID=UPI004042DF68